MNITTESLRWNSMARGVLLIIISTVSSIILVNIGGFLLPFLIIRLDRESEEKHALMELGMSWLGIIPVLFAVLLVVGVWKGTPVSALEQPSAAARFRLVLRGLISTYALLLGVAAVWRFRTEAPYLIALAWVIAVLRWAYLLVGLSFVRRVFARLGKHGLARRSGMVAVAYAIAVVLETGFSLLMRALGPEGRMGGALAPPVASIFAVVQGLLALVFFVLMLRLLWKLRRALLAEHGLARTFA